MLLNIICMIPSIKTDTSLALKFKKLKLANATDDANELALACGTAKRYREHC